MTKSGIRLAMTDAPIYISRKKEMGKVWFEFGVTEVAIYFATLGGEIIFHLHLVEKVKNYNLQFSQGYSKVSLLSFCSSLFAPSFSTVTEILEANSGILSSQQ